MRKQCTAQLTERMDAEEYRLEYHWAVIQLPVHKQDNTRVQWNVQPSLSFQWGHCLQNALVASLNLNLKRDLVSENDSRQTCLKLLLTFYAQSLGTTLPKTRSC